MAQNEYETTNFHLHRAADIFSGQVIGGHCDRLNLFGWPNTSIQVNRFRL